MDNNIFLLTSRKKNAFLRYILLQLTTSVAKIFNLEAELRIYTLVITICQF